MAIPRISYPFDPTGISPGNIIPAEQHVVTEANFRDYYFIVPKYAPFFADSIVVTYSQDGTVRPLVQGVDYYPALPFIGASRSVGKAVYGAIAFNNLIVTGAVSLRYQTIGGIWLYDDQLVLETLANLAYNPKITSWEQVTNTPNLFPPIDHEWNLQDLVGEKEIVDVLNKIEQALLAGVTDQYRQHLINLENPHLTTKQQVGLGLVENYAPATAAQARLGTSTSTVITPATLKFTLALYYTAAQVDALIKNIEVDLTPVLNQINAVNNRLSAHINDNTNPHNTSKAQVGLGNVENLGIITDQETQQLSPPRKYLTFDTFKNYFSANVIPSVNSFVNNAIAQALALYKTPLSQNGGNLLQSRGDGLYYGIEAPADVSELYIDAVAGLDTNTGTRAFPLKSLRNALDRGPANINRTIYLYNSQEHIVYTEAEVKVRGGKVNIRPYGPIVDSLPNVPGDSKFNSVAGRDLNTTIVAGNFRVFDGNGILLQVGVAMYPSQGAFITTEGISFRAGVPTTSNTISAFDGSFHNPFETGSWDIYWGNVTLPSPISRFLSNAAISPISVQFRVATLFGSGKVTEANSKNKTVSVLPYHVSSTQNDEFAKKYISNANVSTRVYNGISTNLNPPVYVPVLSDLKFSPESVSIDQSSSNLKIYISGLEPGVQTTVGPISIQAQGGFVYNGVVAGSSYKSYVVFGDSAGNAIINEILSLNKPTQGAYIVTVGYGQQPDLRKELIVTSSVNSVQQIYPNPFRNTAFFSQYYFPGLAGAVFSLVSGSLPSGISISATANQVVTINGTTSDIAGSYNSIYRAPNAAGGFDEVRVFITLSEQARVINPTITGFSASPDPTIYTQVFDVFTNFRQAKPNTVYTAVVYQNVYSSNVICAFLGSFITNNNGDSDLYYQGTDDVYGTADTVVAQLTTYIAEGSYTFQQMQDVTASGVAPYVVAQAVINHTFAGVRQYTYTPPSNDTGG